MLFCFTMPPGRILSLTARHSIQTCMKFAKNRGFARRPNSIKCPSGRAAKTPAKSHTKCPLTSKAVFRLHRPSTGFAPEKRSAIPAVRTAGRLGQYLWDQTLRRCPHVKLLRDSPISSCPPIGSQEVGASGQRLPLHRPLPTLTRSFS